jgi:hypothetical protein
MPVSGPSGGSVCGVSAWRSVGSVGIWARWRWAGLPSWAARWRHRQQAVRMTMIAGLLGPDLMDINDSDNYYVRWESPWYIGDYFDKKEGGV